MSEFYSDGCFLQSPLFVLKVLSEANMREIAAFYPLTAYRLRIMVVRGRKPTGVTA
jgi:hypothetical protein